MALLVAEKIAHRDLDRDGILHPIQGVGGGLHYVNYEWPAASTTGMQNNSEQNKVTKS